MEIVVVLCFLLVAVFSVLALGRDTMSSSCFVLGLFFRFPLAFPYMSQQCYKIDAKFFSHTP